MDIRLKIKSTTHLPTGYKKCALNIDIIMLKVKGYKKIYHTNINKRKLE